MAESGSLARERLKGQAPQRYTGRPAPKSPPLSLWVWFGVLLVIAVLALVSMG